MQRMSQRRELSLCRNQPYEIDSESDERKSAADDRKAQKEFILFLSFDFMEHSFYAFLRKKTY